MSDNVLRIKSKEFAKDIVILCRNMRLDKVPAALTNQLLRAGTSVGQIAHEIQYIQDEEEQAYKLKAALRGCIESEYWLELLCETGYVTRPQYKTLMQDCSVIRRMLLSSCNAEKDDEAEEDIGERYFLSRTDEE